eukprot:1184258-Prorocentrum_minimum.AAC.2
MGASRSHQVDPPPDPGISPWKVRTPHPAKLPLSGGAINCAGRARGVGVRCVSRRGAGVPSQRHRLTKRGFTCTRKRSAVEKGGFAFILFICLLIKVGEEDSWSEGSHSRLEDVYGVRTWITRHPPAVSGCCVTLTYSVLRRVYGHTHYVTLAFANCLRTPGTPVSVSQFHIRARHASTSLGAHTASTPDVVTYTRADDTSATRSPAGCDIRVTHWRTWKA